MRLIIDAGSTKMGWILMEGHEVKAHFVTKGFNPNYSDRQDLVETCHGASLPNEIHVTHDLMAVCHAVLGHDKGIACILGTGSNSCVYDGQDIVERAVSLGYLVGDEGSGMHIGREVVRAYFYGFMPEELRQQFQTFYHLELKDFVQQLYHVEQPSRYLASFAKFAGEHQNHPFIYNLVNGCFKAFVESSILRFEGCRAMKVSFIGSVAYHFKDILKESLAEHGLTMGEVMPTPAEGLIRYYQSLPA